MHYHSPNYSRSPYSSRSNRYICMKSVNKIITTQPTQLIQQILSKLYHHPRDLSEDSRRNQHPNPNKNVPSHKLPSQITPAHLSPTYHNKLTTQYLQVQIDNTKQPSNDSITSLVQDNKQLHPKPQSGNTQRIRIT